MSHTPHELLADFPEFADRLSALKTQDAHFAKLAESYHALNREVHAAETRIAPISPEAEADLRKRRAALKDEIYAMLSA